MLFIACVASRELVFLDFLPRDNYEKTSVKLQVKGYKE